MKPLYRASAAILIWLANIVDEYGTRPLILASNWFYKRVPIEPVYVVTKKTLEDMIIADIQEQIQKRIGPVLNNHKYH